MLTQVEHGPIWELPSAAPGILSFCPPDVTLRSVTPVARFILLAWDTDFHPALLPERGANASRFEPLLGLHDPLLGQIATTLAQEVEGGFADRILVKSLGTALCIRLARRFVAIFCCRPARAFRRKGCSAYATTSKRVSMTIYRSPCSRTSLASAPTISAAPSRRR